MSAQPEPLYLGVARCSGTVCHGSAIPREQPSILRNESRIWSNKDRHSLAYATLSSDRSKRIVAQLRNSGMSIGPANASDLCLDCHATNPDPDRRGPDFLLSDGVSCESCHGPSEAWIETHDESSTLGNREEIGMVPTWDIERRADLCLSCHLGTSRRFATHELMAAGHPRLAFELDTYTRRQPPHFRGSERYGVRKPGSADGARAWAVGQGVYLRNYLKVLAESVGVGTRWPEFSHFDCFGCHRQMEMYGDPTPRSPEKGALPHPGRSTFALFRTVLAVVSPERIEGFDEGYRRLTAALSAPEDKLGPAAGQLADRVSVDVASVASLQLGQADVLAILEGVISDGSSSNCRNYADAEQITMAVRSLLAALDDPPQNRWDLARARLSSMFDETADPGRFRVDVFRQTLTDLRAAIR